MNLRLLLVIPLLAAAARAGEILPPVFPEAKFHVPPLSLAESLKQRLPFLSAGGELSTPSPAPVLARSEKLVSRMPILVPRDSADSAMIKHPDATVDHKLIVRNPDLESRR